MRLENAVAADVLERILSAYGFTMQKELSDKLGIAKSNVASWLQRGQVPGNVLVQCALDTGADIQWLVTGVFANANKRSSRESPRHSLLNGQSLITKMLQSGGKPVLQRILEAYGFKTQKELSEYLGIATGTVSTWVRRGFFPGDVVIACALDTGVPLIWLSTGEYTHSIDILDTNSIPRKKLAAGILKDCGRCDFDLSFIPHQLGTPVFIHGNNCSWIVDIDVNGVSNGRWLLGIEGKFDIYDVHLLPGKNIKVSKSSESFICGATEVSIEGKVALTLELNV